MRLTLGTRLGYGYGVVIAALLAVALLCLGAFEVSRSHAAKIRHEYMPSVIAANELLTLLDKMERTEYLYTAPGQDLGRRGREFEAQSAEFRRQLATMERFAVTPEEEQAASTVSRHFGGYLAIDHQILAMARSGHREEARQLNVTESSHIALDLQTAIRTYRRLNLGAILDAQAHEEEILQIAEWLAGGISLLALILGMLIWRRSVAAIVLPLKNLEAATAAIARGRFTTANHPEANRTTEIAALQKDFNTMSQQLESMTRGLEAQVSARTQELQTAKEQLEQLVAELRTLDKMKSDLMAVVSHELLTPINFILAYGSTLEEEVLGPLSPDQSAAMRRIVEGAQRLTRMVRNVLDYTQAESGRLTIRPESLDYAALVHEVTEAIQPTAAGKAQTLEIDLPTDLPPIWGDPTRVGQILQELLDNAIKFTSESGRIRVSVRPDGDVVTTEVTDTGIGMPVEVQSKLFKGFHQGDATSTRAYGGLGLGLAIVYHLVSGMGGSITVDSSPGLGTTVRFTLPRADRRPA